MSVPPTVAHSAGVRSSHDGPLSSGTQQRVSAGGAPLAAFGDTGAKAERLNRPMGIAVDSARNRVLVGDTVNNRVVSYDFGGAFMGAFGEAGSDLGQARHPAGVALDRTGIHCYVADLLNNRGQRWIVAEQDPVDDLPPRAELEGAEETLVATVGETLTLTGRATDAYFTRYTVEGTGPEGPFTLITSTDPVWHGTLAVWDTTGLQAGDYVIMLRVEDEIGNVSDASRRIVLVEPIPLVMNRPPPPSLRRN